MNFKIRIHNWLTILVLGIVQIHLATNATAQEKQDPTEASDVIQQTLSKIRDIEKLDTFVQQNQALKEENKKLKSSIASIQKQVTQLTKDLAEQTAKLRKQLLQMPTFQVQSKVLSDGRGMAILKSKDTVIRIRA